jgi:hypothetical protein
VQQRDNPTGEVPVQIRYEFVVHAAAFRVSIATPRNRTHEQVAAAKDACTRCRILKTIPAHGASHSNEWELALL